MSSARRRESGLSRSRTKSRSVIIQVTLPVPAEKLRHSVATASSAASRDSASVRRANLDADTGLQKLGPCDRLRNLSPSCAPAPVGGRRFSLAPGRWCPATREKDHLPMGGKPQVSEWASLGSMLGVIRIHRRQAYGSLPPAAAPTSRMPPREVSLALGGIEGRIGPYPGARDARAEGTYRLGDPTRGRTKRHLQWSRSRTQFRAPGFP